MYRQAILLSQSLYYRAPDCTYFLRKTTLRENIHSNFLSFKYQDRWGWTSSWSRWGFDLFCVIPPAVVHSESHKIHPWNPQCLWGASALFYRYRAHILIPWDWRETKSFHWQPQNSLGNVSFGKQTIPKPAWLEVKPKYFPFTKGSSPYYWGVVY